MSYTLKNISLQKGKKQILKDVSLSFSEGTFTALLGPNGAGKSSLLKIATGIWPSSSGKLFFAKRELKKYSPEELARKRALLSQHYQVQFDYSVMEIVCLGGAQLSYSQQKLDALALEKLQRLDLAHYANAPYHALSGGEQQRVQLARVLVQLSGENEGSKFVFLDEPTASLDALQQHKVLNLARNLAQEGIGVVAVLHDLNLAAQYAEHLVFLKKGQIYAEGPTEEVFTGEVLEGVYGLPFDFIQQGNKRLAFSAFQAEAEPNFA